MAETCMLVTTQYSDSILHFYQEVFGWKWTSNGDDWVKWDPGDGRGGLIWAPIAGGKLAGWYACVPVKKINETLSKVTTQGGTVVLGRNSFPGNDAGYYAIIADPQGATLALRGPE